MQESEISYRFSSLFIFYPTVPLMKCAFSLSSGDLTFLILIHEADLWFDHEHGLNMKHSL